MIVQTAIETEPAYIDILSLAIAHSPKGDCQQHCCKPSYLSPMWTICESSSGNLLSSVISTLKLIPESADYVLSKGLSNQGQLKLTFKEQWKLLAVEAKNSGLDKDRLQWLVDMGHGNKRVSRCL